MTYTTWQRREHTRELQEYLRIMALRDDHHRELGVDGIFGPETEEAVRDFQRMSGLPVTGKVDHTTWERLVTDYKDMLTLLTEAEAIRPFPAPQHVIRRGDTGTIVYVLQAMINDITELIEELKTLAVTGVYDEDTAQLVTQLQHISGYPETGEVDRLFWDHLAQWFNKK